MPEPLAPWWRDAHDAAQLLASRLDAAAGQAGRDGVYTPPPGSPPPRRRRQPGSLRHLAEVIRTHRLTPGVSVDKDIVAKVLAGELRYITDPVLVVGVAKAAHLIAETPFDDDDAQRLSVASTRVAALVEAAEQADRDAPALLPAPRPALERREAGPMVLEATVTVRRPGRRRRRGLIIGTSLVALSCVTAGLFVVRSNAKTDAPCRDGASGDDIIAATTSVFSDDGATRLSPTLDFDQMNGSARYARHAGRTYYWGRAGSDDHDPHSGGTRVRWRTADGDWHSCATALAVTERGYVHTPAVATTIGGEPVTVQICLWRDDPRRENCTEQISTG
ncbi:hypothetical protein Ait01nite_024760 [Actinoplanes italicus]|uniref:Uncharacterized protein n=1 Tax=Actinoplanes italicus TaxID=113567 RepID=A0A2T0KFJ7_9ACTN|nr:hypothetical protein [Actinoplanes italicus]PRX22150.1 hypothetical protein CLV67_105327 [Actinoplanes italicus]GIE29431.1 hypothetical protein Ait01nite_024760 [Actinoplanes italicus]